MENRISAFFDDASEHRPRPAATPQVNAGGSPYPHLIRQTDIYQAAHARAVFEHQLGQLFNSGASDE
jgi:hypothetical protein